MTPPLAEAPDRVGTELARAAAQADASRRQLRLLLAALLLVAMALRLGIAFGWPSLNWPDEVLQTLEPAHRLAFGPGLVTWEFRDGLRSWVLPGVLAAVFRATSWLGAGSHGYLRGAQLALCLLALVPVAVSTLWGSRTGGRSGALLAGGLAAVWFDLVYFAPRALTEVVAAHVLLAGVWVGVGAIRPRAAAARLALAAALCGTALALRLQLAPAVAVALAWCTLRARGVTRRWWVAAVFASAPLLVFGIADACTWGSPFHSFVANWRANVTAGRSTAYGWLPAHYYAVFLLHTWGAATSIAMFALMLVGARREPWLAAIALAVLVPHSLLGHKEYRFVYPALPFLLLLAGLGAGSVLRWIGARRHRSTVPLTWAGLALALLALASLLAARDFRIEKMPTGLASIAQPAERGSAWTRHGDELAAMRWLSTRPVADLAGVALYHVQWQWFGGYANLHHRVPLYLLDLAPDTPRSAFDWVVARGNEPMLRVELPGFAPVQQFGAVTLWHRDGSCVLAAAFTANRVLERRGE